MTFLPTTAPPDLVEMLTWRRPGGSKSETDFINKYIYPHIDFVDGAGNLWREIQDEGNLPNILFSCHTDTVHRSDGMQSIEVTEDGWIHPAAGSEECLGADCGAGIWLMLEMIKAKIPGLYVFHREEECGGIGSDFVATKAPQYLNNIDAAIAFDRRGFDSIITHQYGSRCCSDGFAKSLAGILAGEWKLDDGGTFTDTANYTGLIGECTNLSVGYFSQHTKSERQSWRFIIGLRDALIAADWSKLEFYRQPGEPDPDDYKWYFSGNDNRNPFDPWADDDDIYYRPRHYQSKSIALEGELSELTRSVIENPYVVAQILNHLGYSAEDIAAVRE